jgi:O-acetylhomoserine (thiol)-lyase
MRPETRNIHAARQNDAQTGATQTPVHLSAGFAYESAEALEDVFSGAGFGYVYSRIGNPTVNAFELRLAALDRGTGAAAVASGMAAVSGAILALAGAGDNIVSSANLFGGTWSLFKSLLPRFGVEVRLVDPLDQAAIRAAIDDKTRLLFLESVSNPAITVADIPAWGAIAKDVNLPLVVDNTVMAGQIDGKKLGVALFVYSTTKWIDGQGRAIGGAIVDAGGYKWRNAPHEHLKPWVDSSGPLAFLSYFKGRMVRDLGFCLAPLNAWIHTTGLDHYQLRFDRHCENAARLATALAAEPSVREVLYPGLPGNAHHERAKALFGGKLFGPLLSIRLADKPTAMRFLNAVKLGSRMTNLGDARTLVVHPWSTINNGYSLEDNVAMGVDEGLIRVSVGLENVEDLIEDFQQALAASVA